MIYLGVHVKTIKSGRLTRYSMLNLQNVPNNAISGLGTDELQFVTNESSDRFLIEFSDDFLSFLNDAEEKDVSQVILDDLDETERQGIPKSSLKQMENTVKRFTAFLSEKKLSTNLKNIPISVLNNYLR